MRIRVATMADSEAITGVINAAFRPAESFFIDRDRMDLETLKSLLQKGTFLIADDGGDVIGCVYLELRGDRAYLGLLSVDPKHQKAGLGSTLMTASEKHCAEAGCQFMDLQIVNLRTENHAFYIRRGYIEAGIAPFPVELTTKLPCHFVRMSKPLN